MAKVGKSIVALVVAGIARFELTSAEHVRAAFHHRDAQGRRPAGFYRVRRDVWMFSACALVVPCGLALQRVGVPRPGQTDWLEVAVIAVLCVPTFHFAVRTFFERPLPFAD